MEMLDDIRSDLKADGRESDYTAVNTLWLALLKLANLENGKSELARMDTLVGRIPEKIVRAIVNDPAVDALLNLNPPLETIISHQHELLETVKVTNALEKVRAQRAALPREGLAALGFVLKVIRNKREHGFKTRDGSRDTEILHSARQLLANLCQAAFEIRVDA